MTNWSARLAFGATLLGSTAAWALPPVPPKTTIAPRPPIAPPQAATPKAPFLNRLPTPVRVVARGGWQAGGIALGLGEKAIGKHSPDAPGVYHPVEVPDPNGTRSVVVYRSNQPKTVDDIANVVDMARQHGATPSQIAFINLRSEKDEDRGLLAQYQSKVAGTPGAGTIRQVDVKILDNAPPAFYIGPLGWKRAVDQVRTVYTTLKDPSIKVAVIHCDEGEGRTGEIIATAVRIAMDGMPVDQALAEASAHGLSMPWQQAFVTRFAREWQSGKIKFD